jgi:hypothetical protein
VGDEVAAAAVPAVGNAVATFRDKGRIVFISTIPLIMGVFLLLTIFASGADSGKKIAGLAIFGTFVAAGVIFVVSAYFGVTRVFRDHLEVHPYPIPFFKREYPYEGLAGIGMYQIRNVTMDAKTGRTYVSYPWQLVLWYADGSTRVEQSITTLKDLGSNDVAQEFAHGDPIVKTKAGQIAQVTYQHASAFQGPTGELSKSAFPTEEKEMGLGVPIARWTPYAGLKVLTENPDVEKYYPNEVPKTPADVARQKENFRHNALVYGLSGVGFALFIILRLVSINSGSSGDPATAAWFNNTVNPGLSQMNLDMGTWSITQYVHSDARMEVQACHAGFKDAAKLNSVGAPSPVLGSTWGELAQSYRNYFRSCNEVLQAHTAAQHRAATRLMSARLNAVQDASTSFDSAAYTVGYTPSSG